MIKTHVEMHAFLVEHQTGDLPDNLHDFVLDSSAFASNSLMLDSIVLDSLMLFIQDYSGREMIACQGCHLVHVLGLPAT